MKLEILEEAETELNQAIAHARRRPDYWIERKKRIG